MFHVAEDLGNEMRQRRRLSGDAPIRCDLSSGADVVVRPRERRRQVRDDVRVVDVAQRPGPEDRRWAEAGYQEATGQPGGLQRGRGDVARSVVAVRGSEDRLNRRVHFRAAIDIFDCATCLTTSTNDFKTLERLASLYSIPHSTRGTRPCNSRNTMSLLRPS